MALDINTTLVVAAYAPELAGLAERGIRTRAIGIGLVAAAGGAARVLAELRPARVLLVGTAGALPGSSLAIGDVVLARQADLTPRAVEYLPGPMEQMAPADPHLRAELGALTGAPAVRVACPLGITCTADAAARLGQRAEIEQLECFALFREAARTNIAAGALLAISNRVGPDSAAEWRAHRLRAETAALAALLRAFFEPLHG